MFNSNGIYLDSELREKLLKIRSEVIEKCSEVIHRDYEDTNGPNIRNSLKIRNYVSFPVSKSNRIEGRTYRYVYEEYKFPYLVNIIDRLLRNDINAVNDLYKIDLSKEITLFEDKIERVCVELDSIPNRNIKDKRAKLDELEYLLVQSEYNRRQVSVVPYYQMVIDLIEMHKVKSASLQLILK